MVHITGCDLVYPIPDTVQAGDLNLFALIPSNPAYWTGTKIAQLAPAFANFRPISITFSYIPQVAVTQSGTVYMGTLWNNAVPSENIQQSLYTSNGGATCQCYMPCDTTITLGSNLQQNLFTMNGSINPNTSPFLFMAGVAGADVIPGYFVVSYAFEFKNPLGQSWYFGRSPLLSVSELSDQVIHMNQSLVLMNQSKDFGPGTVLDLEGEDIYYHGTRVELDGADSVIMFYNDQSTAVPQPVEPPSPEQPSNLITQFRLGPTGALQPLSELTYTTGPFSGGYGFYLSELSAAPGMYVVAFGTITIGTGQPTWYYQSDEKDGLSFLDADGNFIFSVPSANVVSLSKSLFDQTQLTVTRAYAKGISGFPAVRAAAVARPHKIPEAASSREA